MTINKWVSRVSLVALVVGLWAAARLGADMRDVPIWLGGLSILLAAPGLVKKCRRS